MANKTTLKVVHKQACKTTDEWMSQDPVLEKGVLAFSSDTIGDYKIGDGASCYSDLPYSNLQISVLNAMPTDLVENSLCFICD